MVERIHGKDEVSGSTPDRGSNSDKSVTLSRAACPPKGGRAPPAAPFAFFLRFPPAEFLFLAEKGLAGGSPAINGRGGVALVGKADALRAFVL